MNFNNLAANFIKIKDKLVILSLETETKRKFCICYDEYVNMLHYCGEEKLGLP